MAARSEGVISPVPRKQYVYPDSYRGYGNRVLRVLLGIGWGLRDYCFALIRTNALSSGKPVRGIESGA